MLFKHTTLIYTLLITSLFSSVSASLSASVPVFEGLPCATIHPADKSYGVCTIGSRMHMFNHNELAGSISLQRVPTLSGIIALGPVSGLKGEITVYDGQRFMSSLDENGNQFSPPEQTVTAIFLALGYAKQWISVEVETELKGLVEIETFVIETAQNMGIQPGDAFPFKIEGSASDIEYHVIFKNNGLPHSKALHKKAKVLFTEAHTQVRIAGIRASDSQMGHITHQGKATHLHLITNSGSGHIDNVTKDAGASLYLPSVSIDH